MFNPQTALDVSRQRHRDYMAEVNRKHLAEIALSGQPESDPFYYQTLAALGRRLSDLGDQLQERYSPCECELVPAEQSGR